MWLVLLPYHQICGRFALRSNRANQVNQETKITCASRETKDSHKQKNQSAPTFHQIFLFFFAIKTHLLDSNTFGKANGYITRMQTVLVLALKKQKTVLLVLIVMQNSHQ